MKSHLTFLGQGWFRSAWKVELGNSDTMVLKTLRLDREFLDEYYELHRRDAVAMERLTFSPFVMDVYGYCGQSALNEMAGMEIGGDTTIFSLEQLNRRLRDAKQGEQIDMLKLRLALSVAVGLSHVHNVNNQEPPPSNTTSSTSSTSTSSGLDPSFLAKNNNNSSNNYTIQQMLPALVHYDINPRNIAIVKGGRPKLNDFNIAEFLKYDPTTNQTCGFPSRLHEPWWRAPEEMNTTHLVRVNEKVDVYALGNILYHIWTTHSPRGKMKKERMDAVRELVRQGIRPNLEDEQYFPSSKSKSNSKQQQHHQHPISHAFVQAMELCFHPDPQQRGTVRQVTSVLYEALDKLK
jgi:hypothetical protein